MTYKMIGGDGREYGPIPLEDLKSWALEGRIVSRTLIWSDDSQNWREAAHVPELAPEFDRIAGAHPHSDPLMRSNAANPWLRVAAFLVDTAILWAIADLLWPTVASWFGVEVKPMIAPSTLKQWAESAQDNLPRALFLQACRVGLEVFMLGKFGATPGKLVAGLRVVTQDGARIGYPRALLRVFSRMVSEVPLYAGYLPAFFRKDRKGLHDLLAGTQVVALPSRAAVERNA
jgi:uncharacterized RDD family membrane protein YckC